MLEEEGKRERGRGQDGEGREGVEERGGEERGGDEQSMGWREENEIQHPASVRDFMVPK